MRSGKRHLYLSAIALSLVGCWELDLGGRPSPSDEPDAGTAEPDCAARVREACEADGLDPMRCESLIATSCGGTPGDCAARVQAACDAEGLDPMQCRARIDHECAPLQDGGCGEPEPACEVSIHERCA
ncbi:MAG: hypothetical protein K8H88_32575, partial [Sandaracinaceae bacterium]|nr:hypothetical protein [Sandaracinaceae bacterium]